MSYVKIWIHCVWGTKNKTPFFNCDNKHQVIDHIKENSKQKGICISEIEINKEHVHCLLLLKADQSVAKVMQLIKGESSFWINKTKLTKGKFEWADEYFAASVSESVIPTIVGYIKNQVNHHSIKTWEEEYNSFIKEYGFEKIKDLH